MIQNTLNDGKTEPRREILPENFKWEKANKMQPCYFTVGLLIRNLMRRNKIKHNAIFI